MLDIEHIVHTILSPGNWIHAVAAGQAERSFFFKQGSVPAPTGLVGHTRNYNYIVVCAQQNLLVQGHILA